MKILHVITSLRTGGAEKLMVDLLPRMKAKGHIVELCSFDNTITPFRKLIEENSIKVYGFHDGINKVYNPLNIWRLYKLIKNGKYDIVHTHNTAPELFSAICNLFLKTNLVTTEHSTSNRRRSIKCYAPLDRWMFRQYDSVICISDKSLENHCKYVHKKSSKNACVVYNGIDYNKYKIALPATDIHKTGKKIIINVASYSVPKDQPTLIKAMQYLPNHFHLYLAGDGLRRIEYENLIKELKLNNRVHLLGIRNDIPNILAASDYVVMCSHYEGLSLSSLEGMASGKPFLASNVDGLREIVNGNGVLFEHEDAKGFADAILKLENNEEYRKEIIQKCQAKASQYDISIMVDKYLNIYSAILFHD